MFTGTALVGLSGYVFIAVIGQQRFAPAITAALSATYLLSNIIGPGVFVAAEQETSRTISDALARGLPARRLARRMLQITCGLGALTLVVLALSGPALVPWVLDGNLGLLLMLALMVVASGAVYYVRGSTGGQRLFGRYAMTLVLDGGGRIAVCAVLVVTGNTEPVMYAFALCAGPLLAWACTVYRSGVPDQPSVGPDSSAISDDAGGRPQPTGTPRTTPTYAGPSDTGTRPHGSDTSGEVGVPAPQDRSTGGFGILIRDVSWLLVASVLAMALANLAPVIVTGMSPDAPEIAAGFAAAVVLTRVPLLLMGPIQALVLPRMTAAAAAEDRVALRRDVLLGVGIIGVLGVLAVIGMGVLGPFVVELLFGADRNTTGALGLMLLTASAVIFMLVQLLQPALVAIREHTGLMLAWAAGAAAFAACFALPLTPVDRGIVAQLVAPVITVAVQLGLLSRYLGRGRRDAARTRTATGAT